MIRREMGIFLVVGVVTVLVDLSSYSLVLWSALVSTNSAKAIGFMSGTLFAYFANKFWTFQQRQHVAGSAIRFGLVYCITLGINVGINNALLHFVAGRRYMFVVAFLLATGISAALNFVGMKFFVFKSMQAEDRLS